MNSTALRVAVVCTGNICRSPMGEVLARHVVAEDPSLAGHVEVTSAGTAKWHVGESMDSRARRALDRAGFALPGSPGAFASPEYLGDHDLVLVMTHEHREDVRRRLREGGPDVLLWRQLAVPSKELDVADPYYGDDHTFDECLATLRAGTTGLVTLLTQRLAARRSATG